MKALRNISLTVVLLASLSACVENDPTYNVYPSDDVAFTYHITNEGYELDYLVGSTIQFTNTRPSRVHVLGTSATGKLRPTLILPIHTVYPDSTR